MKWLLSTSGERYCAHCHNRKCNCLPEGSSIRGEFELGLYTTVFYLHEVGSTDKAILIRLGRNVLPNGVKIKTGTTIWIPNYRFYMKSDSRKLIEIDNRILNQIKSE